MVPVAGDAVGGGKGVLGFRARLVAGLGGKVGGKAGLPEEVAAKAGQLASAVDPGIEVIAHLPGPVFVVADDHGAFVALKEVPVGVEVVLSEIVERDALILGPKREGAFKGGPAGGGVFLRDAVGAGIVHVRIAGTGQERRGVRDAGGVVGPADKARGPRAVEADFGGEVSARGAAQALVMVRPAPVVVGAPGAGGEDQGQFGGGLGGFQDKEALGGVTVDRQRDGVDSAGPVGWDFGFKGHRPAAAIDRAVGGGGREAGGDCGVLDGERRQAVADDGQPRLGRRGHCVKAEGLTRAVGQRGGVAPDLGARGVGGRHLIVVPGDRVAVVVGAGDEEALHLCVPVVFCPWFSGSIGGGRGDGNGLNP